MCPPGRLQGILHISNYLAVTVGVRSAPVMRLHIALGGGRREAESRVCSPGSNVCFERDDRGDASSPARIEHGHAQVLGMSRE